MDSLQKLIDEAAKIVPEKAKWAEGEPAKQEDWTIRPNLDVPRAPWDPETDEEEEMENRDPNLRRSPEPAGSSKPLYRSTALAAEMELLYLTYAKPCSRQQLLKSCLLWLLLLQF